MKKYAFLLFAALIAPAITANTLSDITTYNAGVDPRGIIIGDFNGDGKNEVLAANFGSGTLIGSDTTGKSSPSMSLYTSMGNYLIGTTTADNTITQPQSSDTPSVRISAGGAPRGLAYGDLFGNGKADVVVSNYDDGDIMVFEQMNGTLVLKYTLPVGKHPVGVAIGDIDNDGKNDIAVAAYDYGKLVLFMNKGVGWGRVDVDTGKKPTDVAIGKIGSTPILAVANYGSGTISVLKWVNGAPAAAQTIATGSGPCRVKIADVTGDGINDIVAVNFYDATLSVIQGMSNGAFNQNPVQYKLKGTTPNGMATGDLTGNGLNDVVVAERDSDNIEVFLQKNGTLVSSKLYPVTSDKNHAFGPTEVTIGDINGNGMNDIVFTHMRSNTIKTIMQLPPASPNVQSTTHPDQNTWYANSSAVIQFNQPETDLNGISGYYYLATKQPVPFNVSNAKYTTASTVTLTGLETGTWHFYAASKDSAGNVSTKPTEFKINITAAMSDKTVYNYPNPCSGPTTIRFPADGTKDIKIVITDTNNKLVWQKTVGSGSVVNGINYIIWNLMNDSGQQISNGVYFCKVIAGEKIVTKKIAVVR